MDKKLIAGVGVIISTVIIGGGAGGFILAKKLQSANIEASKDIELREQAPEVREKLNGWNAKGANWYYYKNDKEQTGWFSDNNKWYYLGDDGKMRTGWIKDKNQWYYLNEDGTMATNTTIDGCYINEKGLIEKTPIPQSNTKNNSKEESNQNTYSVSSSKEAENIIYNNAEVDCKMYYQGILLPEDINEELRTCYTGFQLNEPIYVFYIYDPYEDYMPDVSCIYYVGKDTGTVYRRNGGYHTQDNAYIIKNRQEVKMYHWKSIF